VLLDLESHPPPAGIDAVTVTLDVAPGHIAQASLFSHVLPTREDLSTLLARLGALMGESRIGAPCTVDTHDARAVGMQPFTLSDRPVRPSSAAMALPSPLVPVVRRFRLPVAARVVVARGMPAELYPASRGLTGGTVVTSAGPWRSSGTWWRESSSAWDRDEWDVEMTGGTIYLATRDRGTGRWAVDGIYD
jgi:protein ImuB